MATAAIDAKLDFHSNLTEHPFQQDFDIQNFAAPSTFEDGVPASETLSLCFGNIVLQLRVLCKTDVRNTQYNQVLSSNIQLYGLINKGEACIVGLKLNFRGHFLNHVKLLGNIVSKKLSTEKDARFQLITEFQTPDFYNPGGPLTVTITGTILIPGVKKDENVTDEEHRETSLSQELSTLLQNPKYSDVDISVDGKNFSVHKNILWSRSKGFAELLEEMESKNKNCPVNILAITEFSAETVQEALNYMYTGEVPNINTFASDLLEFSDKYKISGLKVLCESEIESSIAVSNACDFADLADRLNAVQLRSYCVDFIKKNVKQIVGTEKWKKFRGTNPDLVADIFESLVIGS